jgi:serine/threonine-protein kinase HipA
MPATTLRSGTEAICLLTPAYDICPQSRTGGEANQAMLIMEEQKASQISLCLKASTLFLLNPQEATELIAGQIKTIKKFWPEIM